MAEEDAERPGRLTAKQVEAIRDLWRKGLAISEIEKYTGAGRATIHRYIKDVPRIDWNESAPMNDETGVSSLPLPQVVDLQPRERHLPQASTAPARVSLGMGIVVDYELIAVLKGFSVEEGYSDLNDYLRRRLVPWMRAVKDMCQDQTPNEFFQKMTVFINEAAEACRLRAEIKKRDRWPAGRAYMIKNMELLGWSPEQIQQQIAVIDEIARRDRAFSN